MIESAALPIQAPLEAHMAKSTPAQAESFPTRETVRAAAQALLDERKKSSLIPERIRSYLDHLRQEGLDKLVQEAVPIKAIMDNFVRKFGWKISPAHLEVYLKETYNYPKKTVRKAAKKARKVTAAKKTAKQRS